MEDNKPEISDIQDFYEHEYYARATGTGTPSKHLRNLAVRLNLPPASKILDIACGTGEWLVCLDEAGHTVAGIDISARAIEICKKTFPEASFHCQDAQQIPYPDAVFDTVTCLGSLEHFPDKAQAVKEMHRVVKPGGQVLILVPNSEFVGLKLGLFSGTQQKDILETPLSMSEWTQLFESCGLRVRETWKDLHVISKDWIMKRGYVKSPLRATAALLLALVPARNQYQNYYLCSPS